MSAAEPRNRMSDEEIIAAADADCDRLDADIPPGQPQKVAAIITAAASPQRDQRPGAA